MSFQNSFYKDLLHFYRSNNLSWNKLPQQRRQVLISAYRRKMYITKDSFEYETIVNSIKNDLLDFSQDDLYQNGMQRRLSM